MSRRSLFRRRGVATSPVRSDPRGELHSSAPKPARHVSHSSSEHEFCVVDVETTGFSPRRGDRVIEIATVRIHPDGTVVDEWTTLVNPSRDISASHIHGITASDVVGAPEFSDIAGDLLQRLDRAVVTGHNIRFDWSFLAAEYERVGYRLPELPRICTLRLGYLLQPHLASRKLAACCADMGIELAHGHMALNDARATAQLLAAYLERASAAGLSGLEALGCNPLTWPDARPSLEPSGRSHPRGERSHVDNQAEYLARLVGRLDGYEADDPDVGAYLDLLDRVLEDRRVTAPEADTLAATAAEWGLPRSAVITAHRSYMEALADSAAVDGIITKQEQADLELVAQLLGLSDDLAAILVEAGRKAETVARAPADMAGLTVCFTGALTTTLDGAPISRVIAKHLASKSGMLVVDNVTKKLDLLVVADPDTQSEKARKAHQLGIRIMAEQPFWRALGVDVR